MALQFKNCRKKMQRTEAAQGEVIAQFANLPCNENTVYSDISLFTDCHTVNVDINQISSESLNLIQISESTNAKTQIVTINGESQFAIVVKAPA